MRYDQPRIHRQWGDCHVYGAERGSNACFSNNYRDLRHGQH